MYIGKHYQDYICGLGSWIDTWNSYVGVLELQLPLAVHPLPPQMCSHLPMNALHCVPCNQMAIPSAVKQPSPSCFLRASFDFRLFI